MDGGGGLQIGLGVATETGRRRRNEDFVGACLGSAVQRVSHGVVAVIADGIGGAPGGREAAELTARGFIDGYYDSAETLGVRRAAAQVMDAINRWIVSIGRTDPLLSGLGCTFTALVLKGRSAHVLHLGDTRLYRLTGDRLLRLTEDHTLKRPEFTNVLYRAVGIEETVRLDYACHPMEPHDRFLLCSDGVHGSLRESVLAEILGRRRAAEDTAREIVAEALAAGSDDNASALVVDVVALPAMDQASLGATIALLPIIDLPRPGDSVDGFRIESQIADGRYSRLFVASEGDNGERVVLKFPHPRVTTEASYKAAFIREAWVAARVRSPWLCRVIEMPPGRQSSLYTVMPLYDGETLAHRLRRGPPLTLEQGREIAVRLGKAVALLHRNGIIHRDIKPDNVILEANGGLKLIDLGVARVPGLEEFPAEDIPGTPSYMAPEVLGGQPGDEKSDLFALGVTLFEALTGKYPYGEIEAFSHPRFGKPKPLVGLRPDIPAWLDASLTRAMAVEPTGRHGDVMEFALEMEAGPTVSNILPRGTIPLYQRDPLTFWKVVSFILAVTALALAIRR